jgi:hypothetical protein
MVSAKALDLLCTALPCELLLMPHLIALLFIQTSKQFLVLKLSNLRCARAVAKGFSGFGSDVLADKLAALCLRHAAIPLRAQASQRELSRSVKRASRSAAR